MKATRRHSLQQNELAKVIVGAPTWWQQQGGRTLLICVAIIAIAFLIRYRINSSRAAEGRAIESLSTARLDITQLQNPAPYQVPPAQLASHRKSLFSEASSMIDDVARLAPNDKINAENLVARGDLNWTLANIPELPGASTQPSLQLTRDPQELIKTAQEAYQEVLNKYPNEKESVIAARFGLAAIDENQHNWDAAKSQYDQIAQIPGISEAFLSQAKLRLDMLPKLREQVLMREPLSLPTTLPVGIAAPTSAHATAINSTRPIPTAPIIPPPPARPPTTAPRPIPTTAPSH